jgi:hypothetical protein
MNNRATYGNFQKFGSQGQTGFEGTGVSLRAYHAVDILYSVKFVKKGLSIQSCFFPSPQFLYRYAICCFGFLSIVSYARSLLAALIAPYIYIGF